MEALYHAGEISCESLHRSRVVIPSQRSGSDASSEESTACVARNVNLLVDSSLPGSRAAPYDCSE